VSSFQRLAAGAGAATYLLIVVGAVVRVTGSGLGCPDWPLCQGRPIPPLEFTALVEYSHRALGAAASLLIVATVASAWLTRRGERTVLLPASLVPLLLAVEIPLGALVVLQELSPMLVLAHLALAMLILGLLVWLAVAGGSPPLRVGESMRRGHFHWLAWTTGVAVLGLVLTGAYVRANGAGWACQEFPTCNDDELLPLTGGPLVAIQLLHRVSASLVVALVFITTIEAWRTQRHVPSVMTAMGILGVALVAQVAIGGATVLSGLPAALRGLHVAGAAAVWVSAIALASLSERNRARPGPLCRPVSGTRLHLARRSADQTRTEDLRGQGGGR
jgi:heme A synthase